MRSVEGSVESMLNNGYTLVTMNDTANPPPPIWLKHPATQKLFLLPVQAVQWLTATGRLDTPATQITEQELAGWMQEHNPE